MGGRGGGGGGGSRLADTADSLGMDLGDSVGADDPSMHGIVFCTSPSGITPKPTSNDR